MEKYLQNGIEAFNTHCSSSKNDPIMLPRAPEQVYIDVYPNVDELTPSFTKDILLQSNYEAEVKVYRALERLSKPFIVLHNFEYTHHQYRLCNKSHVRKGCPKCKGKKAANKEGECDFVIIGSNYFVIIEVKDITNNFGKGVEVDLEQQSDTDLDRHLQALNGTFSKSLEQRKRMVELIHCIDERMTVLHFTAYPNFSKQFQNEFKVNDTDMSSIIFKEDLIKFADEKFNFPELFEHETKSEDPLLQIRYGSKGKWYSIDHTDCNEEDIINEETAQCRTIKESTLVTEKIEDDTSEVETARIETIEEDTIEEDATELEKTEEHLHEEERKEVGTSGVDKLENFLKTNEQADNFKVWWTNHVSSIIQDDFEDQDERDNSNFEIVRNMLIAIWCTNKDYFDVERCSLAQSISKIDEKLQSGKFTFRSKNPCVVTAPTVIKDYLGVSNLTLQQHNLFDSSESMLWINGPAGSGKTVILCGEIIKIAQASKANKVVLLRFCGESNTSSLYQHGLDEAGIKYLEINHVTESTHPPSELQSKIADGTSTFQVIIALVTGYANLTWLIELFQLFKGCHVFVDDIQIVMEYDEMPRQYVTLIELMIKISRDHIVRVACDIAQYWYANDWFADEDRDIFDLANSLVKHLSSSQLGCLSKNLRNTCDLSNVLSILRSQLIDHYSSLGLHAEDLDALKMVLPKQIPGHFIHGPKTVLHIVKTYDAKLINDLLLEELEKLRYGDALCNSGVSVVYDNLDDNLISLVSNSLKSCDSTAKMVESADCFSAEWPVVIVLHQLREYKLLDNSVSLYLALSRARVYSVVVLFPESGKTCDKSNILGVLEKLKDLVQIISH